MVQTPQSITPVLKWIGGKNKIISKLVEYFPGEFKVYHEPFLGGASVFLHLQPKSSYLYDTNPDLINFYKILSDSPEQLFGVVKELEGEFNALSLDGRKDWYSNLRAKFNEASEYSVLQAGRFLALNKTCFNGIYRVNSEGKFNVPFNQSDRRVTFGSLDNLQRVSEVMRRANLIHGDFEQVIGHAGEGSFVYFDPPYIPLSPTSSFTQYSKGGFSEVDQLRLIDVAKQLSARGAKVVISNSSADWVKSHYTQAGFKLVEINVHRGIAAQAQSRRSVKEVIAVV